MEEYDVKKIVESLLSDEPSNEYINSYLNDHNLQAACNEMISNILNEEFSNNIYNINGCLNFLNNVVAKQLEEKPYLLGLNTIIKTIYSRIDKDKDAEFFLKKEEDKTELTERFCSLTEMLMIISDEFTLRHQPKTEAEDKMVSYYVNKINKNIPLSKEEVEEMISLYLTSNYCYEYLDDAMDYALKNIIEQDYKIDEFLYKKLFIHECREQLAVRGIDIKDVRFVFSHGKKLSYEMNFYPRINTISINNDIFKRKSVIENFMIFFHELRHYEQYNQIEDSLASFLAAKDLYLANVLDRKYYSENYANLFYEKNANFESYKDIYDFIQEKVPSALERTKRIINIYLMPYMMFGKSNIYNRFACGESEDVNLLFDKILSKRKDFMHEILGNGIRNSLLIEYSVTGEKRNVLELLEGRDFASSKNIPQRVEIYNYLLYEEPVSFEYIKRNFELLTSEENKEKYGKYYEEARQALNQMLINYRINLFNKKSETALNEGRIPAAKHYSSLVEGLKKSRVLTSTDGKGVPYKEKEDELKASYKFVYGILREFQGTPLEEGNNTKAL